MMEVLEPRQLLATDTWISPTSGSWDVASNWSTDKVPGPADDVVIDDPGSPTVTISSNVESVNSITASDPLVISGGGLTVAANSTIIGGLTMTGGSLTANGLGLSVAVAGTTTASGASLNAENGASLTLSQLTSYTGATNYTTTLQATGAGSVLALPELASIAEPNACCSYTDVQALAGGDVELPALTQVSGGPVQLEGDGTGSQLNVSALSSFTGNGDINHMSILQASNSGTVRDGGLTSLKDVSLSFDPTATLATAQIASFTGGTLSISSSTLSLPALTKADGSNFLVSGGASLTLPALASYTGSTNYATTLQATGAGSVLALPELASIAEPNACCSYTEVQALAGGDVELPVLTQVSGGPVQLEGDGAGSRLDVSALTSIAGDGDINHMSILQASNSGTVLDSDLSTINGVSLLGIERHAEPPGIDQGRRFRLPGQWRGFAHVAGLDQLHGLHELHDDPPGHRRRQRAGAARTGLDRRAKRLLLLHRGPGPGRWRCRAAGPDSGQRGASATGGRRDGQPTQRVGVD